MMEVTVAIVDGPDIDIVTQGSSSEVRAAYPGNDPVQRLITRAIDFGMAEGKLYLDGKECTARVLCIFDDTDGQPK